MHIIPCVCHHLLVVAACIVGLAHYGSGNGTILLDNVGCRGNEANLLYCRYDPDTTDCNHREDAGVRCYPGGE